MFEFVFYYSYIMFAFVIFLSVVLKLLYYLQLWGYEFKAILKHLFDSLKNNYLYILLYVFILFLIKYPSEFSLFVIYIFLNIITVFMVLLGNRYGYVKKVKYTKRLIRLLSVVLCLFFLYEVMVVCIFNKWFYVFLMPTIVILPYLFIYLSLLLLKPIEDRINNHYLTLAKNKLAGMHGLTKVAITGSFGKTSTKEILKSILAQEYSVLATEKSFNTPMGISMTINNRLRSVDEILIAEMGAKAVGEINELCDLVKPNIGIVVSVGRQHLKTFGSLQNVYNTKKELPLYLSNGKCVFNLNDKLVSQMYDEYDGEKIGVLVLLKNKSYFLRNAIIKKKRMFHLTFVNRRKYFFNNYYKKVYAKNIVLSENGMTFDVYYSGKFLFNAKTSLLGIHNIINILLAVGVAIFLNVSVSKIITGIDLVKEIDARLQKILCSNGAIVLNNGYNACLDSSQWVLQTLSLFNRRKRVVITPGLVECLNQYEDNKIFAKMVAKYATNVVIVGDYNKQALEDGLLQSGFSLNNIEYVDKFSQAKKIIDDSDENYVYLIENDLPENYK